MVASKPAVLFTGSRLTDMWRVGMTKVANTTGLTTRILPAAAVVAGSVNGIVELGSYDAADVFFFGTDANNEIVNTLLCRLSPILGGDYFLERIIARTTGFLGNGQVSAAQAAAIDGLAENDRLVDVLSLTVTATGTAAYSPANDTLAYLRVLARGAERISIQVQGPALGGAATVGACVRRLQGDAARG